MKTYTRKEQLSGTHLIIWHCSRRDKVYTIKKCGDGQQQAFDKLNQKQRSQITYDCDRVTEEKI